jgi:Ser/Thr protein kinase RdoA (MazF antagonist)
MDAGFASFRHPAAERELKWNMKFAPATIGDRLRHIGDPGGRALVEHFLRRHEDRTIPRLPLLRKSIIHNDANDNHVLVGRASADPDTLDLAVTGIIDFGDMVAGFPWAWMSTWRRGQP